MLRKIISLSFIMAGLLFWGGRVTGTLAAPPVQAITCAEDYTVQAGDWLSTIAEKYYGDPLAYPVLVEATNLAAQTDSKYTPITDPAVIEVAQLLCVPSQAEATSLLAKEAAFPGQGQTVVEPGKMLLIVGNRSLKNIATTLSLSGGEFGDGQDFVIKPGEEMKFQLAPADYKAGWLLPSGTVSREFEAVADLMVIAWLVPENDQVFAQQQWAGATAGAPRGKTELGHLHLPSIQTQVTPYGVPAGQGLLVAGDISYEGIYALLGLVGGRFGDGQGFLLSPGEETMLLLEPGSYQVIWSAQDQAVPERLLLRGEATVSGGQVVVTWVLPAKQVGYVQPVGQAGVGLQSVSPPSEADTALLSRLMVSAGLIKAQ